MSHENVEIVRAAVEATNRSPKPNYETMNALIHPDHPGFDASLGRGAANSYLEYLLLGPRRKPL